MEGENDKETSIGFKVHESEKRRWIELAERNGLSLSSFIRQGVRAFAGEKENDVIARHDVVSMLDDLIATIRSVPSGNSHSCSKSGSDSDGSEVEKTELPPVFVEEKNLPVPTPSVEILEALEAIADAQDGRDASTESRDPVPGIIRSGELVAFIPFTVTEDESLKKSILSLRAEISADAGKFGGTTVRHETLHGNSTWKVTATSKEAREAFIKEFFRRGGK